MQVLINGDDFGWTKSCSLAILEAFEKKLINTTTMMSTGGFFDEAIELVQTSDLKSFTGIHFDLTEGIPLTDAIKKDAFFCNKEGEFLIMIDRLKPLSCEQKRHAYDELKAQADRLRNAGIKIHHADSHHHIHTAPAFFPIVMQVAREYGIQRIRSFRNYGSIPTMKRIGKTIYNLVLTISGHKYTEFFCGAHDYIESKQKTPKNKTLEIMVHPDFDKTGMLIDRFGESTYEDPIGDNLSDLLEVMNERGDSLVSW